MIHKFFNWIKFCALNVTLVLHTKNKISKLPNRPSKKDMRDIFRFLQYKIVKTPETWVLNLSWLSE